MTIRAHASVFRDPLVIGAFVAALFIAVAGVFYFMSATKIPAYVHSSDVATTSEDVVATGFVQPSVSPDLGFTGSGRIVSLRVKVGDRVSQGQVLATLDTGTLSAQRAQAQAQVDAAAARLAELKKGARTADVAVKQTSVDQATAQLQNVYVTAQTTLSQAFDKAYGGLVQNTDSLFNQPYSANSTLTFSTNNSDASTKAISLRVDALQKLTEWKASVDQMPANASPVSIETAITDALQRLRFLRVYADALLQALAGAISSTQFTASSQAAAQANVASYRDAINTQITSLESLQQQIKNAKLSIQSANDSLAVINQGSTAEQLAAQQALVEAAQASVAAINAQIRNNLIIAPFTGTVASVHVKLGDIVSANVPAIALNPASSLQIQVFVSVIDSHLISVGDPARVTLDAYGESRMFDATVVSIDSAPSIVNIGTSPGSAAMQGYKVTLQFAHTDKSISTNMAANVTIHHQSAH